ncbi:phage tail protein [Necropsobacter rosorum]|uniref:phage tail protein n=1 Tax=Necropsobacter rosorum TaxID=908285 RepID=UPI003C7E10C6
MANLKEQEKWDGIYQIEENDPVLGGENGITNKPIKQLANRTLWLKKALELLTGKSKPKDLTAESTSVADKNGHSHALPKSSTSQQGVVQLDSATNSTAEDKAATPKAVKIAYDKGVEAKSTADKAQKTAEEKLPLSGGKLTGNLSIDNGSNYNSIYHYNTSGKYTLSQGSPDTSPNFYAIAYFNTDGTRENAAFFPKSGATEFVAYQSWVTDKISDYIPNSKRSNATNSASRDTVATSFAAKTAFDKGVEAKHAADTANDNANGRVSKSGDTMTGHLTIKANGSDYSSMRTYNTAGRHARWESAPESSSYFAAIINVNSDGAIEHRALIRKRSGTLAFDEDVALKAPKSEPVFITDKIYTNLDAVPDGTSFFGFHSTAKNIPSDWINSNADLNGFQVGASYQKFQIVVATAGDIRIRLNDDGTNWSSWEKFAMISDVKWATLKDKPATATRWPTWSEVTSKPSTFPPSSHNHAWTQITNAPSTATRWPTWSEVTGKPQVVQDVRLGATVSRKLGDEEWQTHGAGYVVTGFYNYTSDLNSNDWVYVKPIQKNINGTWVTVANA